MMRGLKAAARDFVGFDNYRCCHKSLGDISQVDMLEGPRKAVRDALKQGASPP